jgi:hypothetical protein
VATAIGLASAGASAQAGSSTFTTIDVTGAGTGAQQGTAVTAVDAAGDIAGVYIDTNNALHCFVLPAGGSIANCDVSGAGSSVGEGTFPTSINTSGTVAGSYVDASQISHGFVRAVNGTITKFDAPLASQVGHRGTTVLSIDDSGVIVGTYTTGTYSTTSVYGGFMRSADGTTYTTINDPNEGTGEDANGKKQGTTPVAMNASGVIAGYYIDSNSVQHGFVRSASGTYTSIDPTGAGTCINQNNGSNFGGATASGIDVAGDVAGTYLDTSCVQHGFIRSASGTIASFDVPGANSSPCTTNGGSSEKICGTFLVLSDAVGDLTGSYVDTNGAIHGFLRPSATGIFTSFNDPNASASGSLNGTLGIAINSRTSGIEIAGSYLDANSVLHGYIYSPALTATTTTLTPVPTPNPSIYQEPVTLTATVTSSGGPPANGESVTFMSGATSLGTAQLTSGTASLTTTELPVGTDSITAVYDGDSAFAGSTSAAVTQTVNKASSSTTVKSSLNPSTFGQSVTLTANVSGQFSGVATGTVTFSNGSSSLGSATVSSNTASLATTTLPVGTDSITAVYSGDSNFTGSTSNTVSQVVNDSTGPQPATSIALAVTSLGSPVTSVTSGTVVTLTATVMTDSAAVTTGQVKFCDATATYCEDIHLLGSAQLTNSGTAAIKLRPGIGSHSYKAVFVGTKTDDTSTSSASPLAVTNGSGVGYPTTTTIAQSGTVGNYTLTATVTGSVDRSGLASPSGTVSFLDTSDGNAVIGSAVLTDGTTGLNWLNSQSMVPSYDPTAVTVADFNQDGIPDLAVYNFDYGGSNTSISIFLGKGDGTFTTAASPATPTGAYAPDRFVVGDFNQDGIPDLAVINEQGEITIFLGKGDGTFNAMPSNVPGTWGNIAAVGDFNGDGILDLLVAGSTPFEMGGSEPAGSLTILAGKGDGTFTQSASPAITGLGDLVGEAVFAVADLNGDGNLDLVYVNQSAYSVSTLLSNGNGTFTQLSKTYPTGTVPYGVTIADFNEDGIPDVVTSSDQGIATVLLGKGDGTFTAAPSITVALPENAGVAAADFNQDGKVDLVFAGANGSALVYLGNGDGTFTLSQYVSAGDFQWGVAVGDFNGDGVPDFALTMRNESTTSLGASSVWVELTQLTTSATAAASGLSVPGAGPQLMVGSYAGDNNYASSVSQAVSLNGPAATPTFSPVAGTYAVTQSVTISDTTSGATIYYTTNGTTPTTSSTVYSGPITVSSSETIEAIAAASGYSTSAVATAAYTITPTAQAATPTFSPIAGTYSTAQSVTISDTTPGATIYYTTNGTTPATSSTKYTGAITVSSSETIEAIATASGYSTSAVATAAYTITSSTGATLVGAPNSTGSYYGMFGTDFAAEFTLSTSANVTTIDVVVLGNGIYDFSLQNSLTGSITTFAQAVITAPNSGANTEAITVNKTLSAGTYYLVASKDAASTQTVPGWFVSDGTYLTNAGSVANGDWYSSSLAGPWTFESGLMNGITYVAPTFIVNGTAVAQSPAATPTFSLVAGTYTAAQSVTISDTTPGATIYYTTNGTTPTGLSTVYSGPITVSASETLEAIATASGYSTSAVATAAYTINLPAQAATPTFSPAPGTYTSAQSVTISDTTPGATIYYTTNGTTPTTSSTVYSGPITVSSSETLEAIATANGYLTSIVATGAYSINSTGFQGFVLYSTVGNVGSYSEYPNSLITVNPATGSQQLVGQSGQAVALIWLTADPVSNVLYGTGLVSSDSETTLYTINPNSGSLSGQVTLSQSVSAIAASPQGTLYGLSGTTLGTINTTTGQFSAVGTVSLASGYSLDSMTFSPAGVLYGVEENSQGGAAFNQQLLTLNPANGAIVSDIGSLGSYNVGDITFAPDGNIYATNFSYGLLKINPQTASNISVGGGSIGDLQGIAAVPTSVAATPAFSPVAGAYTSAQFVTITDATAGATFYYTTDGTTPTTSSTVYNGPISVSSSETIEAIAAASGYTNSAVASATYTINSTLPQAATPTFSPIAGTYTAAQSVTISDATSGATIYYTTNGTTPTTSSSVYSSAITVSSTETLEAIATASGYTASAVATAAYTINLATNPAPVISGMSPAFTNAGGAGFTLTVKGSGFTAGSTVYWGTSALATTYVSATQLTAQVPAADIATGGITVAITVLTPAPGGGTSSSFQFEVDSASGSTTGPTFTSTTATVTAGSSATYPVTLPSDVTGASVTCLNLPPGATCSYSSSTNVLTIATSATTPAGTYQITVVFNETVTVAAAFVLLPILLLPLVILRKKLARRGIWTAAFLGLILLASVAFNIGCGGGGSGGGGGGGGGGGTQTQQETSSAVVTLTVQ